MNIAVPWDFRVTLDLYLGGIGIAVFLFTLYLTLRGQDRYWPLIKVGAYVSPIAVGTGLLFLITELGRPERIYTTMFRVNLHSVTSWGGFIQSGFIFLSLVSAFMIFKNGKEAIRSGLFRKLQVVGAIFAVGVGFYHGLLLLSLGRPLWSGGLVPVLFLISSMLAGTAFMFAAKSVMEIKFSSRLSITQSAAALDGEDRDIPFIPLLTGLAFIQLVLLLIWQVSMYKMDQDVSVAMEYMLDTYSISWWGIVIGAGLLVPLGITTYHLLSNGGKYKSAGFKVTVALLFLAGSYTFKHIIVAAGQIRFPFF